MPTSQNELLTAELAKSLESATRLMQDLLGDIKDNATSLAVVKSKLESLGNSVEALSHIVRDGNGQGSMVTRLALAEQSLKNIETGFDGIREELANSIKDVKESLRDHSAKEEEEVTTSAAFKRARALEKLKLVGVLAPGVIALAILIVKMFLGTPTTP